MVLTEQELEYSEREQNVHDVLFMKRGKFTRFLEIHPIC
ncbi:MAG: hypothetical protein ACJAR1_002602 [Rubritalea sp.]|jgi:hypothetical protein